MIRYHKIPIAPVVGSPPRSSDVEYPRSRQANIIGSGMLLEILDSVVLKYVEEETHCEQTDNSASVRSVKSLR